MDEELLKIIRSVKDKWGAETVAAILAKLDSYPIRWNGTLRRSISYSQDMTIDGEINILMADYGKFIDEGVNGTDVNRNSPYSFKGRIGGTAEAIKPWADSKGINNWAVANSIQKKGIKARPFFNTVVENRINSLGVDITDSINQYMEDLVKNYSK